MFAHVSAIIPQILTQITDKTREVMNSEGRCCRSVVFLDLSFRRRYSASSKKHERETSNSSGGGGITDKRRENKNNVEKYLR